METFRRLLLPFILLLAFGMTSFAQSSVSDIIKQGVALHNQGKYAEAVDKYNEALKSEPDNPYANYEIGLSLYSEKKGKDAIQHIEKAVKSSDNGLNVAGYCLLASIYDEDNQFQKSIETFNAAIKINPDYPQIFYNLGITYFRNQKFAEAETSAIEAIKHNPKNASSQRLYALVTFHQNKRGNALLAFCSFLLLEPTGARAVEAYGNIQHIIQGGILTDAKGNTSIVVSPQSDKEVSTLNLGITLSVQSAQAKKLSGEELTETELKSIFTLAGQLSEKKTDRTFFDHFFVDYFYKLAQTANMLAFTRNITLTDPKLNYATWSKNHVTEVNALADWIKNTERTFN